MQTKKILTKYGRNISVDLNEKDRQQSPIIMKEYIGKRISRLVRHWWAAELGSIIILMIQTILQILTWIGLLGRFPYWVEIAWSCLGGLCSGILLAALLGIRPPFRETYRDFQDRLSRWSKHPWRNRRLLYKFDEQSEPCDPVDIWIFEMVGESGEVVSSVSLNLKCVKPDRTVGITSCLQRLWEDCKEKGVSDSVGSVVIRSDKLNKV